MPIDADATIAGLEVLASQCDKACSQITADALHIVQAAAMAIAPVGIAGNSTNAPGDLRRSIDVQGPHGGSGIYSGEVGPTVIYGRQRELGGHIYPKRARLLHFVKFGQHVYTAHVYQHPRPYMKPARDDSLTPIWAKANSTMAGVIVAAGSTGA